MESATTILSGLDICVNRYLADHYQLSVPESCRPPGNAGAARTAGRTLRPSSVTRWSPCPPGRSQFRLGRLCVIWHPRAAMYLDG